jgi:large subunit ribosomal protein L13
MQDRYPEEMVTRSIWGMIPHSKLGRKQIKKLHVFKGPEHSHSAQEPKTLKIKMR